MYMNKVIIPILPINKDVIKNKKKIKNKQTYAKVCRWCHSWVNGMLLMGHCWDRMAWRGTRSALGESWMLFSQHLLCAFLSGGSWTSIRVSKKKLCTVQFIHQLINHRYEEFVLNSDVVMGAIIDTHSPRPIMFLDQEYQWWVKTGAKANDA
jgi:hypothetical protein